MRSPKPAPSAALLQTRRDELYRLIMQNASRLGRLIYIGCLRNPVTGRYERNLPDRFLAVDTDQVLGGWHQTLFREWLARPSEEKRRDLALYWWAIGGSRQQIAAIRELGEASIPPLTSPEDRALFMKELLSAHTHLWSLPSPAGASAAAASRREGCSPDGWQPAVANPEKEDGTPALRIGLPGHLPYDPFS